ncbi:hypothetical protein [Oricola sp.]|uniref:hypothetical protein n=1 Tax=Oricola sp. TaxID=1979950 RepID=UPI0025ED9F32|nr:hypothetical protein [Oricola sp.]MCI5078159.1 hypothetical protein [Oricola sp.]
MPDLCSFREFLKTGCLGALTPEQNLMDVARLLGTPQYWMIEESDAPFPLYWGYDDRHSRGGPSLEISFDKKPPHAMNWFQLEHADYIADEVHSFGQRLAVAMDGFVAETRASELLQSGVWEPRAATVQYNAEIDMLLVTFGRVEVAYMLEETEAEKLDKARRAAMQAAFGQTAVFAEMDARFILNSIYSRPAPVDAEPPNVSVCSGEQYLMSLLA